MATRSRRRRHRVQAESTRCVLEGALLQKRRYVQIILADRLEGGHTEPAILFVESCERHGLLLAHAVESGGDDRHANLVHHRIVDDRAEDDVRVGRRSGRDDLGCLVDLEQSQVAAAGDREQHTVGPWIEDSSSGLEMAAFAAS